MKKYILNIDDGGLCLFEYNEQMEHYIKVKNIEKDKLLNILDTMIESQNIIEKMYLNGNILHIKAIYPFENKTYKKEEIEMFISNKILNNEEFRLALISKLNKYNCIKEQTNENIANLLYKPENINKRRLILNS